MTGTAGNSTTVSPSTSTTAEIGPAAHHAVRCRQPLHQLDREESRARSALLGRAAWLGLVCLAMSAAPGGPGDTATSGGATPEPPRPAGFDYDPPEPGSYRLPPLDAAADGVALDESGAERSLHDLMKGRITVLSFIYTRCGDICPLGTMLMRDLHEATAADAESGHRIAPDHHELRSGPRHAGGHGA